MAKNEKNQSFDVRFAEDYTQKSGIVASYHVDAPDAVSAVNQATKFIPNGVVVSVTARREQSKE